MSIQTRVGTGMTGSSGGVANTPVPPSGVLYDCGRLEGVSEQVKTRLEVLAHKLESVLKRAITETRPTPQLPPADSAVSEHIQNSITVLEGCTDRINELIERLAL